MNRIENRETGLKIQIDLKKKGKQINRSCFTELLDIFGHQSIKLKSGQSSNLTLYGDPASEATIKYIVTSYPYKVIQSTYLWVLEVSSYYLFVCCQHG